MLSKEVVAWAQSQSTAILNSLAACAAHLKGDVFGRSVSPGICCPRQFQWQSWLRTVAAGGSAFPECQPKDLGILRILVAEGGSLGLLVCKKRRWAASEVPHFQSTNHKPKKPAQQSVCKEIIEIAPGGYISSPRILSLGYFWNFLSFLELSSQDWYSQPKISSECACMHSLCECEN